MRGSHTKGGDVVSRVRAMIFDQTLLPGTKIDQEALAHSLQVSTEDIRRALSRLQLTRLVRVVSPDEAFVQVLSSSEFEEIYAAREILEEHVARLAAPRLSEIDLRKIDQIKQDLIAAAASAIDIDASLGLHQDLHFAIYKACGSAHLLGMLDQLWKLSARFRHLQIHKSVERIAEAIHEVHLIVSACHRHDAEGLGWLIRFKVHQTRIGLRDAMTRR